jgi:hypothetical protein
MKLERETSLQMFTKQYWYCYTSSMVGNGRGCAPQVSPATFVWRLSNVCLKTVDFGYLLLHGPAMLYLRAQQRLVCTQPTNIVLLSQPFVSTHFSQNPSCPKKTWCVKGSGCMRQTWRRLGRRFCAIGDESGVVKAGPMVCIQFRFGFTSKGTRMRRCGCQCFWGCRDVYLQCWVQ